MRVVSCAHGHVRVTLSDYNFFGVLEKYNPDTCTFFTPVGEMGFALHVMFEVSELSMGDLPYEEYIPSTEELDLLSGMLPRCMGSTGRSCAISTFASR